MSKNEYRDHIHNVPLLAGLDATELDGVIDISTEDSRVLHIEGGAFDVLLKRVPVIAVKMLPIVASRVARPDDHSA
jgi:hypothetical protein